MYLITWKFHKITAKFLKATYTAVPGLPQAGSRWGKADPRCDVYVGGKVRVAKFMMSWNLQLNSSK